MMKPWLGRPGSGSFSDGGIGFIGIPLRSWSTGYAIIDFSHSLPVAEVHRDHRAVAWHRSVRFAFFFWRRPALSNRVWEHFWRVGWREVFSRTLCWADGNVEPLDHRGALFEFRNLDRRFDSRIT